MTNTPTYQYCHVCAYCIPRTNVHGGYRYWSSRRYTYITLSVVLLTPVTISLTCWHRPTYIAVSVVLLVIHVYHRHADIGPTYSVMSVVLLILVTISVTILQYIYIAVSAVIISARRRYEVNLHCHVDIIYWLRRQHQHANRLTLLYHVTCEPSYCRHILLTKNGILFI